MPVHKPGNQLGLAAPAIADMVVNSAYCYISQLGSVASKRLSVDGTPNGAQDENLFTISGAVEILRLSGVFTDVDDVSAITAAGFDLIDGDNNIVQITSAAGTNLSASTLQTHILRVDQAAAAVTALKSDQVRIIDGAVGLDLHAPFVVNAKNGGTTYLRFNYTSDGGGAEFIMLFEAVWRPLIREYGVVGIA